MREPEVLPLDETSVDLEENVANEPRESCWIHVLWPWAITRLWRNFTVRFKKGDSPGDGNSIKPIFGSVFNRCGFLPVSAVRQFLDYCESPDELTFSRFGRLVTNESGMMCLQNWERTKKNLANPIPMVHQTNFRRALRIPVCHWFLHLFDTYFATTLCRFVSRVDLDTVCCWGRGPGILDERRTVHVEICNWKTLRYPFSVCHKYLPYSYRTKRIGSRFDEMPVWSTRRLLNLGRVRFQFGTVKRDLTFEIASYV